MSKAILIPIKPIWCAKIMNGDKKIEVRKNKALYKATKKLIEKYGYATFFMYCTKDKKHLVAPFHFREGWKYKEYNDNTTYANGCTANMGDDINGKVVAKFTVRKVEEIKNTLTLPFYYRTYTAKELTEADLLRKSRLKYRELDAYLRKSKNGYAYHIEDLVIFDRPKELSEFKHWVFYKNCENCPYGKCDYDYGLCSQCCEIKPLTKAPQNFCYVESEE